MLRGGVMLIGIGLIGLSVAGCNGKADSERLSFQEQVARAQKETDPEFRARQLIGIGYRQGKAKDRSGAAATLQLAWKDCESISDAAAGSNAWALMGKAHAELDNRSKARRAAARALTAAKKIESNEGKVLALARVAQVQYAADELETADATLQSAEKLAEKIDDPQGKTLSLCAIAGAYWKNKEQEQADRVLGAALDFVASIAEGRKRCPALAEIAVEQADMGRREAAAKTFGLALDSARGIEDPYARAYALGELAEKLSAAGLHAKAHEVLDRAESEAEKIPELDLQRQALEKVRTLMGKLPSS